MLSNDTDDGVVSDLSVISATNGANGTTEVLADGRITYSNTGGAVGETDSFSYTIQDAGGETASAIVTLTIVDAPVTNSAPVAMVDEFFAAFEGNTTLDVLANDRDDTPLDDAMINIKSEPAEGSVSIVGGKVNYQHNLEGAFTDSFTYTVTDAGGEESNEVSVSVTLNRAPFATTNIVEIEAGATVVIDVIGDDSDPDTLVFPDAGRGINQTSVVFVPPDTANDSTQAPLNGTAEVITENGVNFIEYTHDGGDSTSASFRYTVADLQGAVSTGQVFITIVPAQNVAPVAVADNFSVEPGPQSLNVLSNDTDSDDDIDTASVTIVQGPENGSAEANQVDGTVTYTHDGSNTTEDFFTYQVSDDQGNLSGEVGVTIELIEGGTGGGTGTGNGLTIFHRDGQTFLTWDETGTLDGYHVYRSADPITMENLTSFGVERLTGGNWGALGSNTSVNTFRPTFNDSNYEPIEGLVPTHFVINDLGPALSDDQGLFVYTTQDGDSSTAYYAVTSVVDGTEDLATLQTTSEPVIESVDQPTDVLTVQQADGRIYTQFMDYSNWNPTLNGYIYNYSVAVPAGYDGGSSYPLMIEPHAHGERPKFRTESEFGWQVIQLFPFDPGFAVGTIHSWWYGYSADHDYRAGDTPTDGVIENFTEQRIMRAVEAMLADPFFNIDDKLIHAYGNSMGASGVVSLALRYPSVLSGVYASQPMMDYRDSPTFFNDEFVPLWGNVGSNLPVVNRGPFDDDIRFYGETGMQSVGVWDWMDHHKQLVDRRGDDFAFMMISHGNQDDIIDWETQGEPTIDALTSANAGFTLVNNNQGHTWAGFDAVLSNLFEVGFGDWTYPVDLSFPAIQKASSEFEAPFDSLTRDNFNLDFVWVTEGIVDTSNQYAITIVSSSSEKTVDVTPRRTQAFRRNTVGEECRWIATDLNNGNVTSGGVAVDEDSLVTVKDLSIATGNGTRLVVDCL